MGNITFRLILILVFLPFLSNAQSNCNCGWEGPFVSVAPTASFVAIVKVKKHLSFKKIHDLDTPVGMEVQVVEVLKGNESRDCVIVWGDNGYLCRPFLTRFPEGSYWVMAFHQALDHGGHVGEQRNDFSLSVCGAYWLKLEANKVSGLIEGIGYDSMDLEAFKDLLETAWY